VIDTAANVVVATIEIPELFPAGIAIAPDGKRLFVPFIGGLESFGGIAVIDTTNNSVVSIFGVPDAQAERCYAAAVPPDNTKLYNNTWISPPGDDVIAVFDPATEGLIATIPPVMSVGVFSPDAKRLYGVGSGGVVVINTTTNAATTALVNLPGASSLAITPVGRHLYVTDGSTNSVVTAETSTNTISTTIGGVNAPGAIAIVPPPSIVPPLHGFKVSKLNIHVDEGHHADDGRFKLEAELFLDVSSSGLDPEKQPVRLQVGPFITTIPAGSFIKQTHAGYGFEGVIDGVHLSVTIKQIGVSRYAFDAVARGASLTGVTNPVQVSLNSNSQGGALADVRASIDSEKHHGDHDEHD
jgi:hypothetical protein